MSRKINLKAVAILLVALLILGGAAYLVRGYQMRRNARSLLVQADRAGSDKAKEFKYLRTYLGLVPGDHEVRLRYALLTHDLARTPAQRETAYYRLDAALSNDPDRSDVRRKAAALAASLGRPADALFHLGILNDQAKGQDAETLAAMGEAENQRRDWKKAAEWYAKAVQADPKRISSYLAHATLLRKRLDKAEEADAVIEAMMKANLNRPDAQVARISFLRESPQAAKQTEEIRQTLDSLIEKYADTHPELLLLAASMDSESGATDKARALLQKGHKLHPESLAFPRELARLELRAGNRAEAVKLLTSIADKLPPTAGEFWLTIELLLEAGDKVRAQKLVALVQASRNEDTAGLVDYLEARLAFAEERWIDSVKLLQSARQAQNLGPELVQNVNLLLARCYQALGDPDRQLDAAEASLKDAPLWVPGLATRAEALVAIGKPDQALASYAAITAQTPVARLPHARLLAASVLALPPERRNWDRPLALLDGAPEPMRESAEAVALRGRILTASGDRAGAIKALEAGLKKHPKEVSLWLALADAADGNDAAAAVLTRAEKDAGDRIELRLARAELSYRKKDAAASRRQIDEAQKQAEAKQGEERERWLNGVGNYRFAHGDLDGADKTFARLAQLHPESLRTWSIRFEIAAARGRTEDLGPIVKELRRLEGSEGTRWRYGQALIFAVAGKPEDRTKARELLAAVQTRRPNWGRPYVLAGQLEEIEGRPENAVEKYRAALDRGEATAELVARLVRLLHRQRNYSEAASALARLRATENAGELGRLATVTSLLNGESNSEALENACKKLAADSKDPLDHLLRARLLQSAGKFDEAEAAYRRAVELDTKRPEGHLALIGFLAEQFPKKTADAVKQAEKHLAANPLALAACYEMAGESERAEGQFRAALKASPDDPTALRAAAVAYLRRGQLATAEPLFKKLIDTGRSDPTSAAWARRTLALALAGTGDFTRYQEALALLDRNARDGVSAQDQRARALVMARQPKDRREAIRNLQTSFARINPTPEEEFFLVALLVAERDWNGATERLLRLLTSRNGANPAFLLFYVGQLIQHDELDKAEHWVKRLEALKTDSLQALAGRTQLQKAKKDVTNVLSELRKDAAKHGKDPARQLGLARLMESIEAHEDAEKALRKFAELRGKEAKDAAVAWLPLIQFLGRRNRVREALEQCGKLRGKVRDRVFAAVVVGVLRDGEPTDAQSESVISWLRQDREKSKDTTTLDLALANVSDLRGKSDEAAAQYRELLKRDDRNVLAHNNLAVLLALHQKKHEAALASIDKALELAGPQPELLDTKGIVLLAAEKPGAAAEALEQATQMTPDPASYFRLATAQLKANRAREARETWLKAKAAGFKVKLLHPLERPGADEALKLLQDKG